MSFAGGRLHHIVYVVWSFIGALCRSEVAALGVEVPLDGCFGDWRMFTKGGEIKAREGMKETVLDGLV